MTQKKSFIQKIKFTNLDFGVFSVLLLMTGMFIFIWRPPIETGMNTLSEGDIGIQNRYGLNIAVSVDTINRPRGLAFIAHGFGGNKEDDNIISLARTFNDYEYSTVRFDATHSTGQSEGDLAYANPSTFRDDLSDVISWAKTQEWYEEPFYLCGYSLGALASTVYAEQHPEEVEGLVLVSPLVAGQLHISDMHKRDIEEWKQVLLQLNELYSQNPTDTNVLRWFPIILDLMRFDLTQSADKLTMPVLIVVGQEDLLAPPGHQEKLSEAINGKVELAVIEQGDHFFQTGERLEDLIEKVENWLAVR